MIQPIRNVIAALMPMHSIRVRAAFLIIVSTSVITRAQSTQLIADSPDPLLGKTFRSRIDGISFNPPAGGAMIRELNSGEIVRFVYTDESWDIRIKPIPLHVPLPLSARGDGGVLELTATQLTNSNPTAEILSTRVDQFHASDVGVIEARYTAGIDRVFAQQAIFKDTDQHYFAVQMTSRGKPKTAPVDQPDPGETRARTMFQHMLDSVRILDRQELAREQIRRIDRTHNLYLLLDRKTILAAMQPLQLMRVVRDGKEAGYIQVNQREAKHNSSDGIEIILHSRVKVEQQTLPLTSSEPTTNPSLDPNAIVVSKPIGPTVAAAGRAELPHDLYTSSIYFMAFNRDHEDWTTVTQTDDEVASQLTEAGYSDLTIKHMLDPAQIRASLKHATSQPQRKEISNYILDVDYTRGRKREGAVEKQLAPFYLPQALGQMLPALVPRDPGQYMFAFYVGGQRNVMARYLDVQETREVELDGQTVLATPVSDRIGVDGIPTIHYVTTKGRWLGSVNEDSKLVVLPTDEQTLEKNWPGFAISPLPPQEDDSLQNNAPPGR